MRASVRVAQDSPPEYMAQSEPHIHVHCTCVIVHAHACYSKTVGAAATPTVAGGWGHHVRSVVVRREGPVLRGVGPTTVGGRAPRARTVRWQAVRGILPALLAYTCTIGGGEGKRDKRQA